MLFTSRSVCLDTLIFLCHRLKCLSKDLIKSFRRGRRNYTKCGWTGAGSLPKTVEMKALQSQRYLLGKEAKGSGHPHDYYFFFLEVTHSLDLVLPASSQEMESLALLMACSITQQLQITCCKTVSAIQGLPSSLQDKVKQALSIVEELRASFSAANSFQDLSSSVLTQSQRKLAVIQEYMEELLDYLKNNTPLSWLVGPFCPREEEVETSQEEEEPLQEKEAETAGAGEHEASTTLV